MFRRDKGISRKSYKKLVRGAIRLPIAFLRLNTMLKGKKQRKVALIMKLAISNFSCPAETHITNFTRLPLVYPHVNQQVNHETLSDTAIHCFHVYPWLLWTGEKWKYFEFASSHKSVFKRKEAREEGTLLNSVLECTDTIPVSYTHLTLPTNREV